MTYRSSWSSCTSLIFLEITCLTLIKFYRWNSFPDFLLYHSRYCADFWHVSQLPAFLKPMHTYKDRHISFILKGDQIPSFTSKKDIMPPRIHAAGRGLGVAMQYFQNACLIMFSTAIYL